MATATLTPLAELKNLIIFAQEVQAGFVQVDTEGTAMVQGNPSISNAIPLPEVVEELERRLSPEQLKDLRLGDSQELAGQIPLDQQRAIFYTISLEPSEGVSTLGPGERQPIWLDIDLEVMAPIEL